MSDAVSGIRQAFQAAFGRDVQPVAPTAARFDIFNGIYITSQPGVVFVNTKAKPGFIQVAGHELWHAIRRTRPELVEWFRSVARPYWRDTAAYRAKLDSLLQPGEKPYSADKAQEELEADFLGDSLADEKLLGKLAGHRAHLSKAVTRYSHRRAHWAIPDRRRSAPAHARSES